MFSYAQHIRGNQIRGTVSKRPLHIIVPFSVRVATELHFVMIEMFKCAATGTTE